MRGGGAVYVRPIVFPSDKPILLHELLHAYHFKALGRDRPEIEQAYRHARQDGVFPARFQSALFLANGTEFFAVTGTVSVRRHPATAVQLRSAEQARPAYLSFLAGQFGPHACHAKDQ